MQDFRELKVWAKSHQLTLDVYAATTAFRREQLYGLTSQIRRASGSIPANIAEGCGRGGRAELAQFLTIAAGSASELCYHLLLARDLGLIEPETYGTLSGEVDQVMKMLRAFIARLRFPAQPPSPETND